MRLCFDDKGKKYPATLRLSDGVERLDYGDRDTNAEECSVENKFGIRKAVGKLSKNSELLKYSNFPHNILNVALPGL